MIPLTTLPVIILDAPPVPTVPPPVTIADSDDEDEYVDIDAAAIEYND